MTNFRVVQVGNLRPIGNRPFAGKASTSMPINNRQQVANLPYMKSSDL